MTAIYDALTDDEQFRALPGLIAESYGARSALLAWHGVSGAPLVADSGYWSKEDLAFYASSGIAAHDPWLAATADARHHNVAVNLERLVPIPEYERSLYYNEFIRRIGDDTMRAIGLRTGNRHGIGLIAIHRGKTQESFGDEDVATLQRDGRHLRRMLAIRARLASEGQRSATLEGVLDNMRDAALVVQADRRIVYANRPGEELLKRRLGLQMQCGVLRTSDAVHEPRLIAAVEAVFDRRAPSAGAVLLDGPVGPTVATVSPLRSGTNRYVLVLVPHRQEAENSAGCLPQQLRRLFGLTAAEADVALQIAAGKSPSEIAQGRGVGVETVRSQAKAMMAKLGCRRQAEVAALIHAIPLPPGGWQD